MQEPRGRDVHLMVRDTILDGLRRQYPWMKTEAIAAVAARCQETSASCIKEQ